MSADPPQLLDATDGGDPRAAEQLLPLVYDELRRLAERHMRREASDHTLQATALVHEAYVRLVGRDGSRKWGGRRHFLAAAAAAMRRILVDEARRRQAAKRGGGAVRQDFDTASLAVDARENDRLLAVDEAVRRLAAAEPGLARLVELRFFGGLTLEEAAEVLDISPRTAKRHWSYARAWLRREMDEAPPEPSAPPAPP